jgi:pimeloyl-ACP methyl ester carboxylesterase
MLETYKIKHRRVEADGLNIFYREAGVPDTSALLLLHGFPSSSHSFRDIMSPLAEVTRVVAPDLPGFGFTEAPNGYDHTFENMGRTIDAFTDAVGIERFYLYIHDFGAPVAYHLALARPERVLGLIIQNGNAHEDGLGPSWDAAKAYWADPTPGNRSALPDWLSFEGTRDQYVGSAPDHLKPLYAPEYWHIDWERMNRPGIIDVQFRIFTDYAKHVARFPEISAYHREHQPRSLLLWGRHDPYFELEEVLAYSRELDRLDMHILDGGHLLLETHSQECAALMYEFIRNAKIGSERL